MKKVILTIVVIIISFASANAEWDLNILRTVSGRTNMRLLSVPFEGLNRYTTNTGGNNRISSIFNGPVHRRFITPVSYVEKQILNFSSTNTIAYLASCFGEVVSTGKDVYGFGKYLVEFENFNNPSKNISFVFNTLDSKVGRDSVLNGRGYHSDWSMIYYETVNSAYVVIDNGDTSNYRYIDTVFLGQTNREINYWYAYWRADAPLEKNFYARTTPFPMNPYLVNDSNKLYDIKIGTKITFDTVYHNFGAQDRFGYNTVETNGPHDYYNSPPNIPDFNPNQKGNIFTTPADLYLSPNDPLGFKFGMKITAENTDSILIKRNKILYINGYDPNYGVDTLLLKQGSAVIKEEGAKLNACNGGVIIDEGCNTVWSANSMQRIYDYSKLFYRGTTHSINNGGKVEIDNLAELHLGNNTVVTFDGANTSLNLKPGAKVFLGENAKIEFKNGAYLIADGSNISSLNNSYQGKGLYFENSGQNTITGCSFSYLKNPIYIMNTPVFFGNIYNNTFNTSNDGNYMIETKNANNITISYNHIHMQNNKGVGILMRYPASTGNSAASSPAFYVNILDNEITDGVVSAAFVCLTDSYADINFIHNQCTGNTTSANIVTRHITGNFKDNTITSTTCKSLELNQSIPNFLNNTFTSANFNVNNFDSYPRFAPVSENTSDGGWVWLGGRNFITSSGNGNIYYYGGNALLDWGENHFAKNASYQNLWGEINEPNPYHYYVRNNCFGSSYIPSTGLVYISDPNQSVDAFYGGSNINCSNSSDAGTIWLIRDFGNGIYDTLYKTSNNSGYQPSQDEALYSSAVQKFQLNDYFSAITYYKSLITNFPSSSYTDACLYSLYKCYQALDTSYNLNTKDILYTDLKNYLDGRILTGIYSEDFNYNAYEITVMCLASINSYNEAMAGYEFIALYHPDAYTRLLASWDYSEIQALLNGSGGISGREENLTDAEYMKIIANRVNKGINEDPIKKKVKKSFDKVKTEKTSKLERETLSKTNDVKSAKLEVAKMKQKDEMMNTKVTSVMRYSKTLKKEEREKMQIEDILFSRKTESKEDVKINTKVPDVYSLSQNYPNPFNPATKINYALPKTGLVTMKIYDVTGREIQTLVNDVKQAGNYTVEFNGSNLASGVYFYKIQSGDFVSVKRMVLIK